MKRSSHVALLLMGVGVTGAGAAGYMITRPPPNCVQPGGPPALSQGARDLEPCPPRRSWSAPAYSSNTRTTWTRTNSSSSSTRSGWWPVFSRSTTRTSTTTSVPLSSRSSTSTTTRSSTTTTRSGFGSTSRSYSSSYGG